MESLTPKGRHNYGHLSVPNSEIIVNAYTRKKISYPLVARRCYCCLDHLSNYSALECRRSTSAIAGSSYSISLDAFVPVDAAVAALFLTAAVESQAARFWRDCADSVLFDRFVSGERV